MVKKNIKAKYSREEYFDLMAETIVWAAIHAANSKIINHRCDFCKAPLNVPNPYYKDKFLCEGKCKKYGRSKPISINRAKKMIIKALDCRT